jgi:DNA-binding HxlR family transcriptional regulator
MDAPSEPLEACPHLTAAFTVLGKRWNALVLDVLGRGPLRFVEIHRAVPRLSDRVLGERLRELTELGIVEHVVPAHGHPTYRLTPTGGRLLPALEAIRGWGEELISRSTSAAPGTA